MANRTRTLWIGLTASLAVAVPYATVTATDSSAEPPPMMPSWIERLIPNASERILLASDEDFEFVDGGVLVSEPAPLGPPPRSPSPAPAEGANGSGPADAPSPISEAEAFNLHSNAGADKVIYLDFNGHDITGTAWNSGRSSLIEVGEYSREPEGEEVAGFTQFEIDGIVEIWERVAEDFAPWPVDVTTADPGDAALHQSSPSDSTYGARVVITHDDSWYGSSGGVAYVGVFGRAYYSPAFVFSNNLSEFTCSDGPCQVRSGNPKSVAEAVSHEAGHNLGLSHDGAPGTGYYSGHGNWAPIMGVGYYKPVTQWSKGEYEGATQLQDDIAIIDNQIPGRVTGSGSGLDPLGASDSTTIATLADGGGVDTYILNVTEGPASVSVSKTDAEGNLLAELSITNGATGETTTLTPGNSSNWTHTVSGLDAGSYAVSVRSVGWNDAETQGFSSYGSMGQYVLTVDIPGTTSTSTTTTVAPDTTTTVPGSSTTTTVPGSTTTPPTTTNPQVTTTTLPNPPTPPTPPPSDPETNRLDSFAPVRLLDTRQPNASSGRLGAGDELRLRIAGIDDIAADARAAVINVVAVQPSADGYLSVTPCSGVADDERTSSLNFTTGSNVANSTIATLAESGDVCIFASASADIVVDVTGAVGPSGTAELADTSVRRVADSRSGLAIADRLLADEPAVVSLADIVDADTTAVAVNVTANKPSSSGFITIDNCTTATNTAALNFSTGENRGNNGIFALSEDQSLCITASTDVDVIVDLTGEFGTNGYTYIPADPVRVLDTRATRTIEGGASTSFDVPAPDVAGHAFQVAGAASVNLASARHPRSGYVTAWDCGAMPESSAFNPIAGQVTANGALLALNTAGRSCLFHDAGGELIVDLNGWWV